MNTPNASTLFRGNYQLRDNPYLWVTWIAPYLAGEQHCLGSIWFPMRHTNYPKPHFDATAWKIEHTNMLRPLRRELERKDPSATVLMEGEVKLRCHLPGGITLEGKPDLVLIPSDDQAPFAVYDCKTGQPRDSHQAQVGIYMLFLPESLREQHGDREIEGYLLYADRLVQVQKEILAHLRRGIEDLCKELVSYPPGVPPSLRPSEDNCVFCPAREVCTRRI